mgnify:CR=1 FL=1
MSRSKKSEYLSAFGIVFEIWKALVDAVKALGGGDEEMRRILTSKKLREEIAKLIVGAKKLALVNLRLIAENIAVKAESFVKSSFFRTDSSPELYFWDNFKNWVLPEILELVPAFADVLTKTELTKAMYDSEIQDELGNPKPFSVAEFAAVISSLVKAQPNGESGTLLTNGYANIFHVQLKDARVVVVGVGRDSGGRAWDFGASALGAVQWRVGGCVFSRS